MATTGTTMSLRAGDEAIPSTLRNCLVAYALGGDLAALLSPCGRGLRRGGRIVVTLTPGCGGILNLSFSQRERESHRLLYSAILISSAAEVDGGFGSPLPLWERIKERGKVLLHPQGGGNATALPA
ncbi:MAG: hypothetical protein WBC42_04530 [Candidatus Zixiibacteriota bacterium]